MAPNFDNIHLNRSYPSKILLFGEYTVLIDSDALAIPFERFKGKWNYGGNQDFLPLTEFLKKNCHVEFNEDLWHNSLQKGLYFDSNIPIGSGLGSSGSLVAAIYQDFFKHLASPNNLVELKMVFSKIESHFHGKSSGFDPLISFVNKGIWNKKSNLETIDINELPLQNLYLFDSKISRNTANLVSQFNLRMRDYDYKKQMNLLKSTVNKLIPQFANNEDSWRLSFKNLSQLQLDILYPFIPPKVKKIWQEGLDTQSFYMKLCGAGGGGFFLIYSESRPILTDIYPLKNF